MPLIREIEEKMAEWEQEAEDALKGKNFRSLSERSSAVREHIQRHRDEIEILIRKSNEKIATIEDSLDSHGNKQEQLNQIEIIETLKDQLHMLIH